jgi:hypothetical protein
MPVLADREMASPRKRRSGKAHDEADHLEPYLSGLLDQLHQGLGAVSKRSERERKEECDRQHLQNVALSEGAENVFGMISSTNPIAE